MFIKKKKKHASATFLAFFPPLCLIIVNFTKINIYDEIISSSHVVHLLGF